MKNLLLCLTVTAFFYVSACSVEHENDIEVMTLNIRYDNAHDSLNAWPARSRMVTGFINGGQPDIVGLQEVLWNQYEYLDSTLSAVYSSAGTGRDDGARGGELNPVLYKKERFDMIRTITFWLSETPDVAGSKDWGSSLPRVVTWMELADKRTHDHLFFFNTHFAHDSDSARIRSSEMLLDRIAEIAGEFPFIVTGDFNMLPDSKGYAILTGPDESVPLLLDSYFISDRKPSGPSYTFNGFSDEPGAGRIDYIFVRNGMKVLEHKVFVKKEGKVFISDHWPVEASVSRYSSRQ